MAVTKEGFEKAKKYWLGLLNDFVKVEGIGKENVEYYKNVFDKMNLKEAQILVDRIKSGTFILPVFVKNMDNRVQGSFEKALQVCKKHGIELFQRVIITDPITGEEIMTPEKTLMCLMPTRRQIHHLQNKIATQENDKVVDHLTGQVTGDSKGASLTFPEHNALEGKGGLTSCLVELAKIRGGDTEAYKMAMESIKETGGFNVAAILEEGTETESVATLRYLLLGMHLDNNA